MTTTMLERCEVCDEELSPGETSEACGCVTPAPNEPWPAGVAWEDLSDDWHAHFTSLAWDYPPTCCGQIIRLNITPWSHGECVHCGKSVYC